MEAITLGDATLAALRGVHIRRKPARSGAPHRTGQHVLRDSIEAGTFEEAFFAAPAPGETDRFLRIAKQTLIAGKNLRRAAVAEGRSLSASERLLSSLTRSAIDVYERLLTIARVCHGRIFPSYDDLAEKTGLGRATVARALAVLEAIGFLVRQRRFVRVASDEPGPRYEQTSNAYRLLLPERVMKFIPRWLRPAPLPDDELQRLADRAADTEAMLSRLSCKDLANELLQGPLAKVLAKLGASIDRQERESQNDPQPLPESYIKEIKGVGLVGQRSNA
jgi:DNA-binding transcriptional regulator YhcF (GntR family)